METGVAGVLLQCVYDGCMSNFDMEKERRPYHRNCSCALHKSKKISSNLCSQRRKISFPVTQSWSKCSLSMTASTYSTQSSSPAIASQGINTTKLGVCGLVEESDSRET